MRVTQRQREILALMAKGLQDKHIAHELGLTLHVVQNHNSKIYARLGLKSQRSQAIEAWRRNADA